MKHRDNDISQTAPPFSLGKVFQTISRKGIRGAIEDPEQGPHVHLVLLMMVIFITSFVIILITNVF